MSQATRTICTVEDFYAHALAIEREAAERYWEFAHQLFLYHKNDIAEVFLRLASMESQHLDQLELKASDRPLPKLSPEQYCWRGFDCPEQTPLPMAQTLLKPTAALKIALDNERRAKAFYEEMAHSCTNPEVRQLAEEFAGEEGEHIVLIERALRGKPL